MCPAFHGISGDVFAVAPRLRAAFVNHNPRRGWPVYAITLDPARLHTYAGAGLNAWTGHAAVLRRSAASLVECSLDVHYVAPCPEIVLPALRRLSVRRAACLQFISAPALEELFLSGKMSAVPPLWHSRALKKLVLPRPGAGVAALLAETPALETLTSATLTKKSTASSRPEFAVSAFFDMLEARRLESLILFCDLPEPDVSWLAKLRAAGLRISIRSRKEFQLAAWLPEGLYLETFNWNC
ncbi:hypothetical protein FB451DRAFT_1534129 [Mycena latifolia]|nr:hypothetical protein FB451DRAFT_1534129 [Mycena latifolia]